MENRGGKPPTVAEIQKAMLNNQGHKSNRRTCSARLLPAAQLWQAGQPRAGDELHDFERSHYNCVCNLANETATHLSRPRNQERNGQAPGLRVEDNG